MKLAGYALHAAEVDYYPFLTLHGQQHAVICVPAGPYAHLAATRQYELCHSSDTDNNVLVLRSACRHRDPN